MATAIQFMLEPLKDWVNGGRRATLLRRPAGVIGRPVVPAVQGGLHRHITGILSALGKAGYGSQSPRGALVAMIRSSHCWRRSPPPMRVVPTTARQRYTSRRLRPKFLRPR